MKSVFALLACLFIFLTLPNLANEWKRVYLATYPRSGNHWMRYLIEEASNIATSSVYADQDPVHLSIPFPWGGYCPHQGYEGNRQYPKPGDIVVVKTHYPALKAGPFDSQPYIKAIRIVRHPVDSIYSFYLKQNREKREPLTNTLKGYINAWRRFQKYWNAEPNVFTVRYEDLFCNPEATLAKVLHEIGYDCRNEDIKRAVNKYPPVGNIMKHFIHFSTSDLELISRELGDLMEQFDYSIPQAP